MIRVYIKTVTVFTAFIVLSLLTGCATTPDAPLVPIHIDFGKILNKHMHLEDKIPLKVAILIPDEVSEHTYHYEKYDPYYPSQPVILHTGHALKRGAIQIFGEFIEEPILITEEPAPAEVDAVLKPTIEGYSYSSATEYMRTRPMGDFFSTDFGAGYNMKTTNVTATTKVVLLDTGGDKIWSDTTVINLSQIRKKGRRKDDSTINTLEGDTPANGIQAEVIVAGLQEMAARMYKSKKVKAYVASLGKGEKGITVAVPVAANTVKKRVVVMKVQGKGLGEDERSIYRTGIVAGLKHTYEVLSGIKVDRKVEEIFEKESQEMVECDTEKCFQDIAIAFQAELVATCIVLKRSGGYMLNLQINNVFENKAVFAQSEPCEGCNEFKVMKVLKKMARGSRGRR